jgi:hypothetical protein
MIVCWWGQRQRLGIGSRQTLAAATFLAVIVAAIAPGSTLAVAAATPAALGDTIFFMKLLDKPTIVGIVGVLLVENAVAVTSTFIAFGAVPAALLMIWLRREDSSLLSLGVLGLRLWGKRLRQVVHEEPPSSALAQQSAISKSLTTEVSSSFTDSYSLILMSETPVENAEMTSSLEILGILFLIWLKRWIY